ncbi:MAG TPA: glycoside hydrolase family 127 protein [Hyphomonas sp.]|nr:glycoside hydrolase family 127 protein [Hyphomonas sp.]
MPVPPPLTLSRRALLGHSAGIALLAGLGGCAPAGKTSSPVGRVAGGIAPLPLKSVRLGPSPFLDAVRINRDYLHALDADRFLHNFRKQALLEPKGEIYGGWESDTIAGHCLGHYLSACALMYAQTGDETCRDRAHYIVHELLICQAVRGDGYVAGFTRRKDDDTIEPGFVVFDEIARGDIRPAKFYLNGSWAPLYNWHKLLAGLLDAHAHCASDDAIRVAEGIATYLAAQTDGLTDDQMQEVMVCEHGGLNESLAELSVRTGNDRWLALAGRFYHHAVLDPLAAGEDELAFLHANTQIPKVIGLARRYQITAQPEDRTASDFFWNTVTGQRSYVIGGHGDREYFQEPGAIAAYITEQTCESCNTYNMMKLTRLLYEEAPARQYFDYYERCHFNHILAQHRPDDGMFAYMVPLMAGAHRDWSTPFDDFWCCVGSGMESHSKHGDSIWWQSPGRLTVNLYIPSTAEWTEQGAAFSMETNYPQNGDIHLTLGRLDRPRKFALALRIPEWAEGASLRVNGTPVPAEPDAKGYAVIERRWAQGDLVHLSLPFALRMEATPDDPDTIALLYGPLVLAADLGPAGAPYDQPAPALVADDILAGFAPAAMPGYFDVTDIARPGALAFAPFYSLWDRRTAVYFKRFTPAQWDAAQVAFAAEKARLDALDRRAVDSCQPGDDASEQAHAFASGERSYAVEYRMRKGRDARTGDFFEVTMRTAEGPLSLLATYWGRERERDFHILVDGTRIASQTLDGQYDAAFTDISYEIPEDLTRGKKSVRIRFEPEPGRTAGPVFGLRLLKASA